MRILSLRLDHAGRPMVELYVGVPAAEVEFRPSYLPVLVRAVVDTGATRTTVAQWVLDRLGLSPVGQVPFHTASTGQTPLPAHIYAVEISLGGEKTGLVATDLAVIAVEHLGALGVDALLGRDILGRGLLVYDGLEGRFTLAIEPPDEPYR
jgi:predicted aspartyl protease